MISVVIPALNEAATIGSVVQFAWRTPAVAEVIVVDDGSTDDTAEQARAAGAEVITSTLLGKGASMRDGLEAASQPLVVYLDGDLEGLAEDLIPQLVAPLVADEADFVKARFRRTGGRVTALTAVPLLRCFFPELCFLDQPLGGIVAARRSVLLGLKFETDFGVDVGLVIDAAMAGARLTQVDIGSIVHNSRPLHALLPMAFQVCAAILDRAGRHGRFQSSRVREARVQERCRAAERHQAALQVPPHRRKLALLDMDGVLLQGRYVVELAKRCGRMTDLEQFLDNPTLPADERTHRIAGLFRGVPLELLEEVARGMPLTPGASAAIVALRRLGYWVGIVTDSYSVAAEVIRRRVFADFCVGHLLQFRGGKCRGRLTTSPLMEHPQGCLHHGLCKRNVLSHLLTDAGVVLDHVVAVGDGENDICLLESVNQSFAFEPKNQRVAAAAQHVIQGDLCELLRLLDTGCTESDAALDAAPDAAPPLAWESAIVRQPA